MAPHRTSKLGSISAALALVVSGGFAAVRPHAMQADAVWEVHHASMVVARAPLAQQRAIHHMEGPHPGHPAQGANPNCTCAGACMDGRSPVMRTEAPVAAEPSAERDVGATPEPVLPVLADPTAYLRPLPNGPPLA